MNKKVFTALCLVSIGIFSGVIQASDRYDEFLQQAFDSPEPGSRDWEDVECISARKREIWTLFGLLSVTRADALEKTKDYIYETAFNKALEQTRSQAMAQSVAQFLVGQFNREANKCINPTQPPMGAYSSFVGRRLNAKIASAIAQCQQDQYAPSAPPEAVESELHSVYYTPDNKKTNEATRTSDPDPCCICTEVYGEAQRVYFPRWGGAVKESGLYQTCCGHWACVDCTLRWFSSENKSTCPFCRSQVDKKLLEKILNQ